MNMSTLEFFELPETLFEIAAAAGLDSLKFKRAFVAPKVIND